MNIAVLSPGPSLARIHEEDLSGFDLLIGVNHAVERFECDWWVALDSTTLKNVKPLGTPDLYTQRKTKEWLTKRQRPERPRLIEDYQETDIPRNACIYSTPCAVALAGQLGDVTLIGADMEGSRDFAGREGENRTPKRWQREREVLDRITKWLEKRGTRVERWGS